MSTKARAAFWDVALGNNTKLANLAKLAIQEAENESKREWVGLTDEEKECLEIIGGKADRMLAEEVEAKLKEKNT